MIYLKRLLKIAINKEASDLHLAVDMPPMLRIYGELETLTDFAKLTAKTIEDVIFNLLTDIEKERFKKDKDLDLSLHVADIGRFRVNIFYAQQNIGACFRIILPEIRDIEQLGLPSIIARFCLRQNGLILVTGPTGSGKSTTLAAMIDFINQQRKCRIITIEDPIEYIYQPKKSMIVQREVYRDTESFYTAVRQSLRQDPNIICVGEMRDLETISIALTAAETGHLVLSTLHTPDAAESINRIIDVFPPHKQEQVRVQVSSCLGAVIAQTLLPRKDRKGRVVATEILVVNNAVKNSIRMKRADQIHNTLMTSSSMEMHSMDQSVIKLYNKGLIERSVALSALRYKESRKSLN